MNLGSKQNAIDLVYALDIAINAIESMKYLFTRPENQQRQLRSRLSRLKALRRHLKRKL